MGLFDESLCGFRFKIRIAARKNQAVPNQGGNPLGIVGVARQAGSIFKTFGSIEGDQAAPSSRATIAARRATTSATSSLLIGVSTVLCSNTRSPSRETRVPLLVVPSFRA